MIIPRNPAEFWSVISAISAVVLVAVARKELFPLYTEVLRLFVEAQVPMFVKSGAEVSFLEHEEQAKIEAARVWIAKLAPQTQAKVLDLMNALEIWAMPFACGLADRKTAFEPCASGFCQIAITHYPAIIYQRRMNKERSGPFQNVVKLFMAWQGEKEVGNLLQAAARWQAEGVALPPTIGTNLDRKK